MSLLSARFLGPLAQVGKRLRPNPEPPRDRGVSAKPLAPVRPRLAQPSKCRSGECVSGTPSGSSGSAENPEGPEVVIERSRG